MFSKLHCGLSGRQRADERGSSPVVLRLCRAQLADLGRLASTSARRGVVAARLAADVLLEHRVVALEERGDVVPKRGRELRGGIRDTEEAAVGVLDRVQNLPGRVGLVRSRGHVGVVDCHVQDAEGDRVDVVHAR